MSLIDSSEAEDQYFTDFYERRVLEGIGHFLPREQPETVTEAVLKLNELKAWTRGKAA